MSPDESLADLTAGERELLADADSDDVSFGWVLIHLGIRGNPPAHPRWRPSEQDLEQAFASLSGLVQRGLIKVGRIEYLDGGAPGRIAPVRHIEEPLDAVRVRVSEAVRLAAEPEDWEFSCWVVAA